MAVFPPVLAGSLKDGSKLKKSEEWFNIFQGTVKSMHDALSYLYDGVEEDVENTAVTSEGPDGTDEKTLSQAACSFDQCCQTLALMLSTPANGQVRIPLTSVLQEISRCLKVSYSDVRSVPSLTELTLILPSLHQSALHVLSQLIICCKSNLLTHSKTVTEVCLQALASTKYMEATVKSQTRACVYQTLCLWVENFGWRKGFLSHSKSTCQEFISDIQLGDSLKQVTSDVSEKIEEQGQRRKGRKKKKNKAESYIDLALDVSTSGVDASEDPVCNVEATVGALELSKLTLDRMEYSSVESLMRCILETASTIQREGPPLLSPYSQSKCRKKLYKAVFACRTVRLDLGCGRKDAVTHFQLSNLAMTLLNVGCHLDSSYQVQKTCRQALSSVRLTSNLNRPVVRRILPDDKFEQKDATELERDLDQLADENESLKKRLLDSEIEKQEQGRVVAALRQEIETLRSLVNKSDTQPTVVCSELSAVLDTTNTDEKSLSSESDCEEKEENGGKLNVDTIEDGMGEVEDYKHKRNDVKENKLIQERTRIFKDAGNLVMGEELLQKTSRKEISGKKRPLNSTDGSQDQKKHKTDISSINTQSPNTSGSQKASEEEASDPDGVQAMISDFVDADPDLF